MILKERETAMEKSTGSKAGKKARVSVIGRDERARLLSRAALSKRSRRLLASS